MALTSDELLLTVDGAIPAETAPAESGPTALADLGELPEIEDPQRVAPTDARELSRLLLKRLAVLDEGTREYSYVRSTLVELNLSLVRFAVRRFARRSEPQEDLMQVGCVGLIKAIDRFDVEHGADFASFALPTILGELRRHFRDTTWAVHVPRKMQELHMAVAKAQDALSQRLDRSPTVAELAEHLGMPQEEVIEGITASNGRTAGSLDMPAGGHDDPQPLAERLGSDDNRLDMVENLVALKPLIAKLPERERLILSMRFTENLTQSQIGDRLGISQMHVSRLLARTLKGLREGLTA